MPRVFWFCLRPYPYLPYTGLWAPLTPSQYIRSLYLIRAGQIYRAESLPPDLPYHCEGGNFSQEWGIPAVYRQVSESGWVGLTQGCVSGDLIGAPYLRRYSFCFTYLTGSDRLHIHTNEGGSYPLRWKRIARAELEMDLCFDT